MTLNALVAQLRSLNVTLRLEGTELRVSAPAGVLTPELRSELAHRREELRAFVGAGRSSIALPDVTRTGSPDATRPLSFAQERFLLLQQIDPGSVAYSVPLTARAKGPFDLDAFRRAWCGVLGRHDVLHTTYQFVDGHPVFVKTPPTAGIDVVDLSDLSPERKVSEAVRLATAELQTPFDLSLGPVVRARVYRLDAEDHVVVLNMHHIASDQWSLGIVSRELTALYDAYSQGIDAVSLPTLPVQYSDYAEWQRARWAEGAWRDQLEYWRQGLKDVRVLELPSDRVRPPEMTGKGAQLQWRLPRGVVTGLRAVSTRAAVSESMVLLAGFFALLHRYTGHTDIVLGQPVAGRSQAALENLVGAFVNTVAIRADLTGELRFSDLMERVKHAALGAYAHQDFPFERLIAELNPVRDPSYSPLVQVMFNVLNVPTAQAIPGRLAWEPFVLDSGAARFDLSLTIDPSNGSLATLEYSTDLFGPAWAGRFRQHYDRLLEAALQDPSRRVADLPLLSEAEQTSFVVWNETAKAYPAAIVAQLFEDVAHRDPDRVAAVCEGSSVTYDELNRRANQLARYLQAHGARPGVLVGVGLERSIDMLVAVLAVLKSGAAYVPLDPALPRDRLAYMLDDSGARLLVTQQSLEDTWPAAAALVRIDADAGHIAAHAALDLECRVRPNDLAYVIYTSGSTGKPKGVLVTHEGLANFLQSMRERPGFTSADVLLAVTTLSFDIAGLELYVPLTAGGTVVIATQYEAGDGEALLGLIERAGVTVLQATPATYRLLIDAGWSRTPGLRVLCGGEAMPKELAAALIARSDAVWNMYGPTETTIWSTLDLVESDSRITIGRPIANTQIYVLDRNLQPTPVGVPGDLFIGGAGVARGYLGRVALTADKFLPDPFADVAGARMYCTGDVARFLDDGRIECLGRVDSQVKVRGFRIELGEIEAVLVALPEVHEAVVGVHEDRSGDKRLVAYLVFQPGLERTASEVRRAVKQTLPDYMVPSFVVPLDRIPLTDNGKVNRRMLPDPLWEARPREEKVLPRTYMERTLAGIWQNAIGLTSIAVTDNFFELGGHSLLAMQVIAGIEKTTGVRVSPRVIVMDTLQQMAARCEREGGMLLAPDSAMGAAP